MAKKQPPTKEDLERYARLIELGCYIGENHAEKIKKYPCGGSPEIHHIRRMGAKTDNQKSFCACTFHHSAQTPLPHGYAIHKSTKLFEKIFEPQEIILQKVNQQLEGLCC
jgi:hypothetical protein